MKKVGLITFHHAESLGANLQAYALQTVSQKLGYDTEIINYNRNYNIEKRKNSNNSKSLQKKVILIALYFANQLNKKNKNIIEEKLYDFRKKRLNISGKLYNTIDELKKTPPIYDIYLTGSDQVWNPYTYFLEAYFLTFAPENAKRVAYAPSIGVTKIEDEKKSIMKGYLSHVDSLSCRENKGASVLEDITGRNVVHVLDPTLLLRPKDWNEIAIPPKVKKPYVLCYFLGSLKYGRKIAEKIAKEKGLDIIVIPSSLKDSFAISNKINGVGPLEFLGLVSNASFICTDSFHGTAFAINYNKPFLAFKRRNYKGDLSNVSRLESITDILGISNRLLSPEDNWKNEYLKLDFREINIKLEEQRKKSMNFLTESFK